MSKISLVLSLIGWAMMMCAKPFDDSIILVATLFVIAGLVYAILAFRNPNCKKTGAIIGIILFLITFFIRIDLSNTKNSSLSYENDNNIATSQATANSQSDSNSQTTTSSQPSSTSQSTTSSQPSSSSQPTTSSQPSSSSQSTTSSQPSSSTNASITLGQKNAVAKAKSYINYSAFSRKGLIEQLEYEGFTNSEAIYGTDNCGADWNQQAAKKAESYMKYSSFSRSGLLEQLEYEGFTKEQAEYGAKAVGY